MAEPADRRWLVVRVQSPSEESTAWLAEGLVACGASAVQEDAGSLLTWFPAPADVDAFTAHLAAELERWAAGLPIRLEREWRADEDWSRTWRAGLAPRRVGRIVVTPTWCAPAAARDDIVVTIDPQMAFGTGEHASTRGVLRRLQATVRPGDLVLDMGTGSAVLAIAAAALGARRVLAVDHDPDALINARENLERNGCADVVALECSAVDRLWLEDRPAAFDLILANVLSGILVPLLRSFRVALRPGGRAILGGILLGEAEDVRSAARAAGFRVEADDAEANWWSVTLEA